VTLHHDFYPDRPDSRARVEAALVGYLEYNPAAAMITRLRLATREASHGKTPIGAALRSAPRAAAD
jgi:hypothetical protein